MSGMRDVRLRALWRDDPTQAPMTIDLRLEGKRVASTWDMFGAFDLDGARARPFILRRNGRIDFGDGKDDWRTDIRDTEVEVGAYFTIEFNSADTGVYRIVKIAALGAKDRK